MRSDKESIRDAVLKQAGKRESTRSSAKLDWLYEFDPANAQGPHAEKDQPIEAVIDWLLAASGKLESELPQWGDHSQGTRALRLFASATAIANVLRYIARIIRR